MVILDTNPGGDYCYDVIIAPSSFLFCLLYGDIFPKDNMNSLSPSILNSNTKGRRMYISQAINTVRHIATTSAIALRDHCCRIIPLSTGGPRCIDWPADGPFYKTPLVAAGDKSSQFMNESRSCRSQGRHGAGLIKHVGGRGRKSLRVGAFKSTKCIYWCRGLDST